MGFEANTYNRVFCGAVSKGTSSLGDTGGGWRLVYVSVVVGVAHDVREGWGEQGGAMHLCEPMTGVHLDSPDLYCALLAAGADTCSALRPL